RQSHYEVGAVGWPSNGRTDRRLRRRDETVVCQSLPQPTGGHTATAAYRENTSRGKTPMSIIAWIVLGLIAGFIASKIVNKSGQGVIVDIVLGIIGAVVGGFIFSLV